MPKPDNPREQMPECARLFDDFTRIFGARPSYVNLTESGYTLEAGRRVDRDVPPIPMPRTPIE
jgi:hypothetical protein